MLALVLSDVLNNDFIQTITQNELYVTWKKIAIAVGVFVLILFLRNIFAKYIMKALIRVLSKAGIKGALKIVKAFERPLKNFFLILGFYIVVMALKDMIYLSPKIIQRIFDSSVIILIAQGLMNLVDDSSFIFNKMENYDVKVDKILYPFISKTLNLIIIALAIYMIAEKWEYNLKAFITGLGLGGLAFALAAKDAASNIIAGIVIILDKPFSIGDWIQCKDLEGSVEDISFRSTKIRTVDEALITVPNSILANDSIFNFTRRDKRRIKFNLGLTYNTPKDKIQNCINKIIKMLELHEDVENKGILVTFENFSTSSLDISVCYYVKKAGLKDYLNVKEEINFKIIEILEEEKVSLAFPTRTIYIENQE
ncbi:MAG: mechanosensitive ion channel family protein [Clostridium argentinense]|uniref:Mechanosensitive ion channel family protein n=1 Tax=Clostridium faecium TaxID=2762223 RepID=A0ABR8YTY5_9CLOT|nr:MULTISPECIES: mechanosensitive ion channel family protein [Clostridium]MBD8047748.1 mechanosensitive ion channel family protein [Clostridium faecium]MBS5825435.1 mechanosensitive ion channel family protein [Clostridium argentinense]MDU1351039.1 mechanosensitive ion channel family protein [Clostridium argentinense]